MLAIGAVSAAAAAAVGAWAAAVSGPGHGSVEEAAVEALMTAARAGSLSELTELIESERVHCDARAEDGSTALRICAEEGHGNCVRLLLTLGADYTAGVHVAAAAGHMAALQPLLRASAGEAVGLRDAAGMLPLHAAASAAQLAAIEALLGVGASVDAGSTDQLRRTPLMLAAGCRSADAERVAACIKVLLEHGADVAAADAAGDSALHAVCGACGDSLVARALLESGAPMFALNARGQTPMDLCQTGSELRSTLDAALATRMRQGSFEANAAQTARANLIRRMKELSLTDPSLLQSLFDDDPQTRALLGRFALRLPSGMGALAAERERARTTPYRADAVIGALLPDEQPAERPAAAVGVDSAADAHAYGLACAAGSERSEPLTVRATRQLRQLRGLLAARQPSKFNDLRVL